MTKIEKLIEEYEIALVFCGNGENEFSINSIIQTNKTFIEKAKQLFKEEEKQIKQLELIKNISQTAFNIIKYCNDNKFKKDSEKFEKELKEKLVKLNLQPILNYAKGTDTIKPDSVSYVCDNSQFQVNKHYFFDNIESAQEFYKKERDLIFQNKK